MMQQSVKLVPVVILALFTVQSVHFMLSELKEVLVITKESPPINGIVNKGGYLFLPSEPELPPLQEVEEDKTENKDTLGGAYLESNSITPNENSDSGNSMIGRFPNVLYIGAQKAGTTATTTYLERQWQSLCLGDGGIDGNGNARRKEIHFFNGREFQQAYGENNTVRTTELVDEYRGYYVNCTKRIALDATTLYLHQPKTIKWAYETYEPDLVKELKIMVTLREPISRDISWYNHQICTNSFWAKDKSRSSGVGWADYVRDERQRDDYDDEGNYFEALKGWFENFDRKQILVLSYDELKSDPALYFERIKNFLEIQDETAPELMEETANVQDCNAKVRTPYCTEEFRNVKEMNDVANAGLYELLEANPGPAMEQAPFPTFEVPQCRPLVKKDVE